MKYFLKQRYPNIEFDSSCDGWEENHEFECKTHGKQTVGLDYAMVVVDGDSCQQQQLEEPYCPVCKKEEDARAEKERQKIEHEKWQKELLEKQRKFRRDNMNIPYRFKDATFDNFIAKTPKQKAALKACRAFAENFKSLKEDKGGLILMGTVGTGKTHLSVAIGLDLLRQDLSVKYLTIGRLIRGVRESWNDREKTEEQIYSNLSYKFELLIIDEIGVQNCTDNERNILFEVINGRYEDKRPTILVSNLNPTDLTAMVGQRIMDRIAEGGGNRIVFDWESYRQRAA